MGTGPSNLLPLRSRSDSTKEDTFESSGSWFSNWLLESRSISRIGRRNRDLGTLPFSELCDKTTTLRFKSYSQKVDDIPPFKLFDERSK